MKRSLQNRICIVWIINMIMFTLAFVHDPLRTSRNVKAFASEFLQNFTARLGAT